MTRMVRGAAERGATITHRLLAFSRRGNLRAEPVDVPKLLEGLKEMLAHTIGTGIAVQVEVSDELPALFADPGQLETVLINLATNARDAMGGNGTLTLAASVHQVREREEPALGLRLNPGTYVRICVRDTGAGMDAATLAQATEPFFTTKPTGQGTGLGLAMARDFAEQSGGGLHIDSAPGHGTAVVFWLPGWRG
jgi:signal transduction histidine kinase